MIDVETFRSEFRDWLTGTDLPVVPRDFDERFGVLREWQRRLFDGGWMGVSWPTDCGGGGLSPRHQLALSEELVRARAPQPIGLIGLDVVGASIVSHGQPWQKAELLPRLLAGDDIWCQGFSEPESGSDLASLRTSGRIDAESGAIVVTGQKVWTSWANQAQWCALLLRTDSSAPKHKGISYLLVDMASHGITVRPILQMTGDKEFAEVFFDEVRVPIRNLVGELNGGWPIALHTLGTERGSYALRRRVDLEVALEDAVSEAATAMAAGLIPRERVERFVSAIGRGYVASRALEAQTRMTIERLEGKVGPTPADSIDKLILTAVEQRVYGGLADVLGPHRAVAGFTSAGFDTDRWVYEHMFSRAASIYGGTSQIQKNIISQRQLGLPKGSR